MKRFTAIIILSFLFSIHSFARQNDNSGLIRSIIEDTAKIRIKQKSATQTNHTVQHSPNGVTSHDKYANQEVSYAIGKKAKTKVIPAKRKKPKLMEEEGIFYRRRH